MEVMNPQSTPCPKCGSELPPDAPQGLCPRCLAALNFATETLPPGAVPLSPQAPLTPEELAPHFPQLEIIQCLGRGGMGVVYMARQKTLNRLVALKLLAPERSADAKFAARFEKEAQALAALNHPHIVTIHDFGQAGGFFYLLMEYIDGVNLRQAMQAGRFTPEQALAIVPPVCEALQYAHEHGIVHRDIKPENLLLDKTGRVKIADFGIAKMIGTTGENDGASLSQPFGTPAYAAPEQSGDRAKVDHRADIYSLGVILYELLTGELPKDKLEPPSKRVQIDVRLDEIVLRALETKPELRFATAAEFRTQLAGAMAPPSAKPAEGTSSKASSRPRRWLGALGVVLGAALLIGAPVLNEMVDDFGITPNARKHLRARHLTEESLKILKTEAAVQFRQLEAARKKSNAAEVERLNGVWQELQAKAQQAESALNQAAQFKQADEQQRIAIFYLIAGGLIAAGLITLFPFGRVPGGCWKALAFIGAVCAGILVTRFILRQGTTHAALANASNQVFITSEHTQSESSLNIQWTVSSQQACEVRIQHANGRQSSRLQWNEAARDHEVAVRIEISRIKEDLVRIHTQLGDSENTKEFIDNFPQLRDEALTTSLASAKTNAGVSIEICRLLGQPVTLELPARVDTPSSGVTPQEQFGVSAIAFGLQILMLSLILGGLVWLIHLLLKNQRIGCAVVLIIALALLLLLTIPGLVWYLSAQSPRIKGPASTRGGGADVQSVRHSEPLQPAQARAVP
jgi:serine/threonine protein kinase